jgi:hypothetical protein
VRETAIRVCQEHGYRVAANPVNPGFLEVELPAGSDDEGA